MRFFGIGNQSEDPENTSDERPRETVPLNSIPRKYFSVFLFFSKGCNRNQISRNSLVKKSSYPFRVGVEKATSYSYPLAPLKGKRPRVRGKATKATNTLIFYIHGQDHNPVVLTKIKNPPSMTSPVPAEREEKLESGNCHIEG